MYLTQVVMFARFKTQMYSDMKTKEKGFRQDTISTLTYSSNLH